MQLVVLAAGHGTRFGGLKQLAPVGPHGEALMDYTAHSALACGFDGAVVVVRDEIREEIERHVKKRWPGDLAVGLVCQGEVPGTAQAVSSAGPLLDGAFGVVNADDLYGEAALKLVHDQIGPTTADTDDAHLLVSYGLVRTVLTEATVKRGLCQVDEDGYLERVVEHSVQMRDDGRFDARPLAVSDDAMPSILSGSERVSMNLWGFQHRLLESLAAAIAVADERSEILLVDVVSDLVSSGKDRFRVVDTDARCLGITHRQDIAIVREQLALYAGVPSPLKTDAT